MLQFWVKGRWERPLRRSLNHAPYRGAAIAVFGEGAEGVAGLEGEVLLYAVDRGEVVVFDLAQLQEARRWEEGLSICLFLCLFLRGVIGWVGLRSGVRGRNVLFAELRRVVY